MPTYLYRCSDGHEVNFICRISEAPDKLSCEHQSEEIKCGKDMNRIPCTTFFNLIGSGWPGKKIKEGY